MAPARVSEDLCWAIVRMAAVLSIEDITTFTGVSRSKVFKLLAHHRATGTVAMEEVDKCRVGRRRQLTLDEVAVSSFNSHICYCTDLLDTQ